VEVHGNGTFFLQYAIFFTFVSEIMKRDEFCMLHWLGTPSSPFMVAPVFVQTLTVFVICLRCWFYTVIAPSVEWPIKLISMAVSLRFVRVCMQRVV